MQRIALVTETRFLAQADPDWYLAQILEDDRLLSEALATLGYATERVDWACPRLLWKQFAAVVIRTPWDYSRHFDKFMAWVERVSAVTMLLNDAAIIRHNVNKRYLTDLEQAGVHTVPTVFLAQGAGTSLAAVLKAQGWEDAIIKPTVSAGGRDTHRVQRTHAFTLQPTIERLLAAGELMVQPFQRDILVRGEITLVAIDGKVTHGLRKTAKPGEFLVQDDHGGSVHPYVPTLDEIAFAERAMATVSPRPVYGRVDFVYDNHGQPAVMEMELVEPELWLRLHPPAAEVLAACIHVRIDPER